MQTAIAITVTNLLYFNRLFGVAVVVGVNANNCRKLAGSKTMRNQA